MKIPQVLFGTRWLWLLPIILIFISGCSKDNSTITVKLDEIFTIGVGQSAQVTGEDMVIKFNEVIGDSRCPQDVTCIWAGEASNSVTITYQNIINPIVLNQPGLTEQSKDVFNNYTLTYSLNPYPKEGEEISPMDYLLTMTVTK